MTVGTAIAVLVGVLALATVIGLVLRQRTGRARTAATTSDAPRTDDLAAAADYGAEATLVQFSTPTCARCRPPAASSTPSPTATRVSAASRSTSPNVPNSRAAST